MEFINDICYLTKGDKVKSKVTDEGGVILMVRNDNIAKIEFFDSIVELNAADIIPFRVLSSQVYNQVKFYNESKIKPKKTMVKTKKLVPDEIDLHAEVLLPNYRHMSNETIVQKQISHLCNYIELAIDQSKAEISIIHGKGTGSLRSQVIDILATKYGLTLLDIDDHGKTKVYL